MLALSLLQASAAWSQEITFDGYDVPCIAYNIATAQADYWPNTLHRETSKAEIKKHRSELCGPYKDLVRDLNKRQGPGSASCDEYPFASSQEGGDGQIMIVPLQENNKQGGLLNGFYNKYGIGDGDEYQVDTQDVPDEGDLRLDDLGDGVIQCMGLR